MLAEPPVQLPAQPVLPEGLDQVVAALKRIGTFIGSPKKFVKAAGLLRQLLASGQLTRDCHKQALFEVCLCELGSPVPCTAWSLSCKQLQVPGRSCTLHRAGNNVQVLVASMADPESSANPELAREYSKMFTAASKSREVHSETHVLLRTTFLPGSGALLRSPLTAVCAAICVTRALSAGCVWPLDSAALAAGDR